ncbi:MAG: nicotinate (nicotinamide) nucleotide adenylyltransferase [Candidatus Izemoplasmataceae bacterium]|jgi:nicotinate-nucleotide adenylyltransferase|uniref:nicotinate (nicotinamide) nucleotide adenylyltransferase n=1 Tax=Liberiplasma polymorphum TaxID=3374570 RepID=UPI003771C5DB
MHIIYGGAFNPPTKAHLNVYHYLKERLEVDSFIYLPVSNAYTKRELASNYHRLNMLKMMTEDYDDISISNLEIQDSEFLGTYQSLIRISDNLIGECAFVIGADNLPYLHTWILAESLLSEFKIIVLNRQSNIDQIIEENDMLKKHRHNLIIFNDFDNPMSSTLFRETFDETMVDEKVWDYITEHQLYKR